MSQTLEPFFDSAVFHYTAMSTFLEAIAQTGTIRFSRPDEMNDPYEYQPFRFIDDFDEGSELQKIKWELETWVANLKIACFCWNRFQSGFDFQTHDDLGFLRPRMWAQYAKKHEGICLCIDKNVLIGTIKQRGYRCWPMTMKYHSNQEIAEHYPNLDETALSKAASREAYVEQIKSTIIADYLGVKHHDFEAEHEFRIVIDDTIGQPYLYIPITNCLQGVILSDKTKPSYDSIVFDMMERVGKPAPLKIEWSGRIVRLYELASTPSGFPPRVWTHEAAE